MGCRDRRSGRPREITRAELTAFLAAMNQTWKPATCSLAFRALQQFFGWLVREEQIDHSPRTACGHPACPNSRCLCPLTIKSGHSSPPVTVGSSSTGETQRSSGCFWTPAVDVLDTGCRRGEIVGLTTADASLDERDIVVVGKGSRVRIVPFGIKTAQVLGRCLRVRDRDRWADLPALWLAEKSRGALGADGIRADARVGRQQTRTWSTRVVTGPRAPVRRSDDASSPAARGRPAMGRPDTPF